MKTVSLAITFVGLVCFVPAQVIPFSIYRFADTGQPDTLAAGADLDGDGVPDLIAAVRATTGTVRVYSGRTGTLVRQLTSDLPDQLGRFIGLLGDLDGDGGADYALGAPADATRAAGAGAVFVLSGRTHRRIATFFGVSAGDRLGPVTGLGDLDADGTPEFAIAAPGADFPSADTGAVYIVSGRSLNVLRSHVGAGAQQLGEFMFGVDDQDRDGVRDYTLSVRNGSGDHALEIFSGRSGLRLFSATLPVNAVIDTLVDAGDVDNDGRRDLAVGLTNANGGLGAIVVLSGSGLGVLLNLSGQADAVIGGGIASIGDFDGDRRGDLAVMAVGTRNVLNLRSGRTGMGLATLASTPRQLNDRATVVAAGDVNRDGVPDLFAANAGIPAFPLDVMSTRLVTLLALTTTGTVNTNLAQSLAINATTTYANHAFLLLSSASGIAPGFRVGSVTVPLNPDGLLSYTLGNPNRAPYLLSFGQLDSQGLATPFLGNFVAPRALIGLTIHHAAVIANAGGNIVAATNTVPLTFVDNLPPPLRVVEEPFASDAQLDRERSGGLRFGTFGLAGGSGVHGDFDHRLGVDQGGGVFEFDLQRDTRNGVQGFAIPASRTLTGREEFVTDGAFQFASLRVPAGITVRIIGSTAARILVRGQALIDGRVDVSGAPMPQVASAQVAVGQAGGRGGCGAGRGGKGADASDGTNPSNGENGRDVNIVAGHAYAGSALGTGGRGALQFPANNAAVTHNYLTSSAQVPAGGGGGGFFNAGGVGQALQSPATPPELAPSVLGGTAFQLFPFPPQTASFDHFLVCGSGGGGGGSHIYFHRTGLPFLWKIGAGGSGGGGAFGLRAGHDLVCGVSSALLARGGAHFTPYLHLLQGPPGPGGGGSGGSFVLESPTRVVVENIDVRGAAGMWVQPGTAQALLVETRGGDGADGFYRVASPNNRIVNANPPPRPDNTSAVFDLDAQAGQQSKWYATNAAFFTHFVRFEVHALFNGQNVVYSDNAAVGPAPRFGDPTSPLWFKLQGARLAQGGIVEPGSESSWRDNAADLNGQRADAFRFVLVRNRMPQLQILRVRVLVRD